MLASFKGFLNSAARSYLQAVDYRIYGLLLVLTLVGFLVWRRWRYDSWPSVEQCVNVVVSLLAVISGLTIGLVFLATSPPAIELLPTTSLLLIGLIVPIIVFGYAFPKLRALFLPPQAPKMPVEQVVLDSAQQAPETQRAEGPQ